MVKGMQYARKIGETAPFKAGILREVNPGPEYVSDEQLKGESAFLARCAPMPTIRSAPAYIRKTTATVHHPIGTLSMAPREKHGCVDTELRVSSTVHRLARISSHALGLWY